MSATATPPKTPKKKRSLAASARSQFCPIPNHMLKRMVQRLYETIDDPSSSKREVTAAARAMQGLMRLNLDGIKVTIAAEMHEEIEPQLQERERPSNDRRKDGSYPSPKYRPAPPVDDEDEEAEEDELEPGSVSYDPEDWGFAVPPEAKAGSPLRKYEFLPMIQREYDLLLFLAEDPEPRYPEYERLENVVIFRLGADADLDAPREEIYQKVPPGPDRALILDRDIPICRRGGPKYAPIKRWPPP